MRRLLSKQPLSVVVLGDSISAGANASLLYQSAPFQPPYPELLRQRLQARFRGAVTLNNLSVGGTDTRWGLTQLDKVAAAEPHLVVLAFGMNDSAGRAAADYQSNTKEMIDKLRQQLPEVELILVASMLGNRDWTTLRHEAFPAYRDALLQLREPGVAVADLTSIWEAFLKRKRDWDQTGNGVNHPNDFGHRVYAQVISSLLDPQGEPLAGGEPPTTVASGPLQFSEQRLLAHHTYAYACAAADLDGDGDLDLTSSDAEPNSNLYLLRNDGKGGFQHSFIQKYADRPEQPIRLERHAIGDINRDGRLDVVIVDNLNWDIRWFENPAPAEIAQPWKLHRVCAAQELPGAYDVALEDLDGDGDLDVAASSWRIGNRFDWFENLGAPGDGQQWKRHEVDGMIGETRTIAVADFNRDGKPDLLGASRTGNQILWYANSGPPAAAPWTKTVINAVTVILADLDGDGRLDIAACAERGANELRWWRNIGPAPWPSALRDHLTSIIKLSECPLNSGAYMH